MGAANPEREKRYVKGDDVALLSRSRSILTRVGLPSEEARYALYLSGDLSDPDREEPSRYRLSIVTDLYREMGEPEEVTIDVRPGDHLNGEG